MEEIKDLIKEDLISKGEYVDDTNEIYNIYGYNIKDTKCVPLVGNHFGQIAILFALMHQSYPELFPEPELNEEIKLQENDIIEKENENNEENKENEEKIKKKKLSVPKINDNNNNMDGIFILNENDKELVNNIFHYSYLYMIFSVFYLLYFLFSKLNYFASIDWLMIIIYFFMHLFDCFYIIIIYFVFFKNSFNSSFSFLNLSNCNLSHFFSLNSSNFFLFLSSSI